MKLELHAMRTFLLAAACLMVAPSLSAQELELRATLKGPLLLRPLCTTFSPDGKLVAAGGGLAVPKVCLWDLSIGKVTTEFEADSAWVASVAFSPDGELLASGGSDAVVKLWDLDTGRKVALKGHRAWVLSVAFSLDGKLLASGSDDRSEALGCNDGQGESYPIGTRQSAARCRVQPR